MSKLLIYYSLSGNGDLVAETLKERGFDVRKVKPKKNMPKAFFLQILAGGFGAGIGRKEPLKDYDSDVSAYDTVVIGSPVWNGRLACPINTVLAQADFSGKALTLVLYSGGGEAKKAEKQIAARFPQAAVIHLKEPKKYPEQLERLSAL